MADRSPNSREVLDALFAFAEDPEEISEMSPAEIRDYLKEEGIDPDGGLKELRKRLTMIEGQERLKRAAKQRQAWEGPLDQVQNRAAKRGPAAKDEVLARLAQMNARNPEAAAVYYRNLEDASDEDYEAMLDDLALLDSEDANDVAEG